MLSFFAIVTAAIGVTAAAPSPTQEWHTDYAKALQQTRTDSRPLLMVIDDEASSNSSLPDGEALKNYDLCRVDASTEYGKKVAQAFKTQEFPYVAFIDKSGSVILHSQSGELSSQQWDGLLSKYRTGEKLPARVVSKPVSTSPVTTAAPVDNYQSYFPTSSKPYCAKCQRGY